MNNQKILHVFIHVPKAAGSSIRSLIEANYSEMEQLPIYRTGGTVLHDFFLGLDPAILDNAKIVYGHIPVVVHNYTARHCAYFTFLRDPVQRAISFFKYVKYDFPEHPLHAKFAAGEVTFPQWCRRRHIEANKQTQMLSGYDRINFCNQDMLNAAKKSLENFEYFGFMEKFQESVSNCANHFDWNTDGLQVRNISTRTNDAFLEAEGASLADLESLKEINKFDVELYEFARNLAIRKNFVTS